jgi:hypothetical protein
MTEIERAVSDALRHLLQERTCHFGHTMLSIRFSDVAILLPASHALELRNRILRTGFPPSLLQNSPLSAFDVFESVEEDKTIFDLIDDRSNAFGLALTGGLGGDITTMSLTLTLYRVEQEQAA